jgi:hypothetical protein
MKKRAVLGIILLSACGGMFASAKLDDPTFLKTYLSHHFNTSRDKCYAATLAALKELEIGVAKEDPTAGTIITERAEFARQAAVTGTGVAERYSQQHKYFLQVAGDQSQCDIHATRYQFWTNGVEHETLNPVWGKEHLWDPFFKTIQDQMQ